MLYPCCTNFCLTFKLLMPSNVTITLRKKPNQAGEFPLAIRITKNRKSTYIYIGHYVAHRYWDSRKRSIRPSHPNAGFLNGLLAAKLAETQKSLIKLQIDKKDLSVMGIKQSITREAGGASFFDLAETHLKTLLRDHKWSRLSPDRSYLNHLKRFTRSESLTFEDINESFLKEYKSYLIHQKGLSERSAINHYVFIRLIYNRAIRQGLALRENYPFGHGKIKIKFPESQKVGLTVSEIRDLENQEDLPGEERHALNVWLFSFYLAGVRISDVLTVRWSDIYDGRLHYRMQKNSKLVSLQLPEKITPLLKHYERFKESEEDYVFPDLKYADHGNSRRFRDQVKIANKHINAHLKKVAEKAGIQKKLTMHIARHSFGHIAEDRIPIQVLQKLYRHSHISTTMQYQSNFMSQETDRALQKIVNF